MHSRRFDMAMVVSCHETFHNMNLDFGHFDQTSSRNVTLVDFICRIMQTDAYPRKIVIRSPHFQTHVKYCLLHTHSCASSRILLQLPESIDLGIPHLVNRRGLHWDNACIPRPETQLCNNIPAGFIKTGKGDMVNRFFKSSTDPPPQMALRYLFCG
jgi:hypothetical protein